MIYLGPALVFCCFPGGPTNITKNPPGLDHEGVTDGILIKIFDTMKTVPKNKRLAQNLVLNIPQPSRVDHLDFFSKYPIEFQ